MDNRETALDKGVSLGSSRNKTIVLGRSEKDRLSRNLSLPPQKRLKLREITGKVFCGEFEGIVKWFPAGIIDLLVLDPPYNLTKKFGRNGFTATSLPEYETILRDWIKMLLPLLKPSASIYVCGDWRSSAPVQTVLEEFFVVRNRITFEREKGRGASKNWKNSAEDIWFATVSDEYTFNVEAVKLKKRVIAPYRSGGVPKDWIQQDGEKFRMTFPSNIWTDITIPFWSMPENTPHPTQKPEKLFAKIILASSNPGDVILDPFAGSGTTAVVAKKLGRRFVSIERENDYCLLTLKRLELAEQDSRIQGYEGGIFRERNFHL